MMMVVYPFLVDTLTLLLMSISTERWSISFEVPSFCLMNEGKQ